jgi:hypothetical protein
MRRALAWLPLAVLPLAACARTGVQQDPIGYTPPSHMKIPNTPAPGSFEDDVAFLEKTSSVIILVAPNGGRVAVSPTYQGRVMTSATQEGGPSLGWINRKFIGDGKTGTAFDNYGGEDRFWLGPEAGQFGLYFKPGRSFVFSEWQTPATFQEGEWDVKEKNASHVVFSREMHVKNYSGADFELTVTREVRLTSNLGGATPAPGVHWVGYESVNTITNTGQTAWTKDRGLLSIWILGMYAPSPDARVIVPFEGAKGDDVVNDRYFGKVPASRLALKDGYLVFVADGHERGKIGLGPSRAKPILGSYSAKARLLTLVTYDKPKDALDYVNSMWEVQQEPFRGDVVNSYNDGPTGPGKASLGGFYEIETSSPAAALAPGESLTHTHRTLHFIGDAQDLEGIAQATLRVSIKAGL